MANMDRLKLKFTTWYCDKEPYGFVEFMQATTAVMRSIDHGNEIEDYLDVKLDRARHVDMMVSSIMDGDPDFFAGRPEENLLSSYRRLGDDFVEGVVDNDAGGVVALVRIALFRGFFAFTWDPTTSSSPICAGSLPY